MRGKHRVEHEEPGARRIIPAHAGQTFVLCFSLLLLSDHPRACGANLNPRRLFFSTTWIIPAHAGQTTILSFLSLVDTDHPRACGANPTLRRAEGEHVGSSPRMRGKLLSCRLLLFLLRIIPAHAGQTFGSQSRIGTMPDHPRACGANGMIIIPF